MAFSRRFSLTPVSIAAPIAAPTSPLMLHLSSMRYRRLYATRQYLQAARSRTPSPTPPDPFSISSDNLVEKLSCRNLGSDCNEYKGGFTPERAQEFKQRQLDAGSCDTRFCRVSHLLRLRAMIRWLKRQTGDFPRQPAVLSIRRPRPSAR